MNRHIYVIGHRNPDTDSIASAIAYAALKRKLGQPNVQPAMAGMPNPQTRYILDRLGIEAPTYLADVYPKVRDVVNRQPVTAPVATTLKQALELFHRHSIRILAVVDEQGLPRGIVSLLKLSEKYLVAGTDRKRGVDTSLRSLAVSLDGTFLAGSPGDEVEHLHLFIGAMLEQSFLGRIDQYDPASILIMTGDRRSIHQAAIERGVRILVVTGGFPVDGDLLAKARENNVCIISTSHDTATAAWLARLSTPLSCFIEPHFETIALSNPLEQLRLKLLHSGQPAVVVVEEDGSIAGVATKSTLLTPAPYALILVDHNEVAQAVPGADAIEILEVIDHHKLGNLHTNQPITFMAVPVGSTCTIIASLYRERNVTPDKEIAALLLAGILSDTVILKSPTATRRDREMVSWLEEATGYDHVVFGKELFNAGSGFAAYDSPEEAIRADFKHFTAGETTFGVGQVEVIGFDEFFPIKEALRQALRRVKESDRLHMAGLMITDISSETTLFMAEGKSELALVMGYTQLEPHLYQLKGVISRKKQVVPHLLKVFSML